MTEPNKPVTEEAIRFLVERDLNHMKIRNEILEICCEAMKWRWWSWLLPPNKWILRIFEVLGRTRTHL